MNGIGNDMVKVKKVVAITLCMSFLMGANVQATGISREIVDYSAVFDADFYDKISLHIERRLKPHKYGIVEVVKSGKKQRNVGNSYFIPAPLLHHYSYT